MRSEDPQTPEAAPPRRLTHAHPAAAWLVTALTIFLVLFPKGGVKLGNIPLTWGYMLIGLSLPVLILQRLLCFPLVVRRSTLLALSSTLPFLLLFTYSYVQNGVGDTGGTVSDIVSFFVLPLAFLLAYPVFLPRIDGDRLARLMCFSVFSAAVFGIVLFVLYPLTGHLIEIPFLTVNASDYGLIEATKHINRGFFLKLISTYNNGNVYGVATLILLPLYDHFEPRAWRRNIVKFALVLTLSRSVWAGLVTLQMLSLVRIAAASAITFPVVAAGPTLRRSGIILATLLAVLAGSILTAGNLTFLLDSQLGGRSAGFSTTFARISLLPALPVGSFSEIIYLAALNSYGVLGLLSIIFIFSFPIVLLLVNPAAFRSPRRLAAAKGLIIYMLVACLDGAINLIPVMAFYWFAYMIFLEDWPGASAPDATPAKVGETDRLAAGSLTLDTARILPAPSS